MVWVAFSVIRKIAYSSIDSECMNLYQVYQLSEWASKSSSCQVELLKMDSVAFLPILTQNLFFPAANGSSDFILSL